MKPLTDARGCEIKPGDVIRVFHFVGARRKRHYMYKQALEYITPPEGSSYLKISHLNNPTGARKDEIGGTYYLELLDGRKLTDYEIVQSGAAP